MSPAITSAISASFIAKDLMLGLLRLGRGGADPVDALIMLAIIQANLAPIQARPELQLKYGAMGMIPPDEVRRPVSVLSVAGMLGLPFETVRRRVAGLKAKGVCLHVDGGLMVPARHIAGEVTAGAMQASYELLREVYFRLRAVGFFHADPLPAARPEAPPAPVRAAIRLSADYFLRMMPPMQEKLGGVVNGFILMEILRQNTLAFGDDRGQFATGDAPPFVPDDLKVPAPVYRVAEALRLPKETVRRRVHAMAAEGLCQPLTRGVIIPMGALTRPGLADVMGFIVTELRRLYRALAEVGAVADWEAAQAAKAG
jgi:hypothetical protein